MSLLALLGNFDNGTSADGPEVAAEYTQILSALNSTSTDKHLSTRFSGAEAVHILNQLGAGPVAEWAMNGTVKARVNNTGQIQSTLATGTAPLVIASTTVNANLNADLLDGVEAAGFTRDPGGNGLVARTSASTAAARTLTAPAAGITVNDGDGVAGNPTLVLANDLAALEGLGSTGIAARTGSDTWAQRTITGTANQITVSNGAGIAGNPTLSTPQDIATGSSPTFANLTISTATTTSTLAVGSGGTVIKKIEALSFASINVGSVNAHAATTFNLTVTGGAVGDFALVVPPQNFGPDIVQTAIFTGADTLTVQIQNNSNSAFDAPAGDWLALWFDVT